MKGIIYMIKGYKLETVLENHCDQWKQMNLIGLKFMQDLTR